MRLLQHQDRALGQLRQHVVKREEAGGQSLRVDEIEDGSGRESAIPEERVDLAVFQGVDRLRHAEVVGPDILRGIEAGR